MKYLICFEQNHTFLRGKIDKDKSSCFATKQYIEAKLAKTDLPFYLPVKQKIVIIELTDASKNQKVGLCWKEKDYFYIFRVLLGEKSSFGSGLYSLLLSSCFYARYAAL